MEFRIADTFTDSLSRLTAEEPKAVKAATFDPQINRAHPSLQFRKLEKAQGQQLLVSPRNKRYPPDRASHADQLAT